MRLRNAVTIGMTVISMLAVLTPNVRAHNQAKYNGVPFVVPSYCTNVNPQLSSKIVNVGGVAKLQVTGNNNEDAGFIIYTSNPGGPLTLPTVSSSQFTEGTVGLYVSGLSGAATVGYLVGYAEAGFISGEITTNGFAVIPANASKAAGAPVVLIIVYVLSGNDNTFATVYFSNFTYNNQPLLFDTTHTFTNCTG